MTTPRVMVRVNVGGGSRRARQRRGLVFSVSLLAAVSTSCSSDDTRAAALRLDSDLAVSLKSVLESARSDAAIPGVQAAVVFPDGTVWTGADGDADEGTHRAATPETRFPVASITKMFTATTILRLVERGQLALDDPLGEWISEVELPDRGERDLITIRQVLNHTSGLTRDVFDDPDPQRPSSVCDPGTCVSYSNLGYQLLGRVIEQVSGDTLAHGYRDEILRDLHLDSTVLATQEEVDGELAIGHDRNGVLEPADATVRWLEPDGGMNLGASGGLVSTAQDVAVFAAALFRGNLIRPDTLEAMVDFDRSGGRPGGDECWARGLGTVRTSSGSDYGQAWGHAGVLSGFTSAVNYYPGYDLAVAVMANSADAGGAQAIETALAALLLDRAPPIHPELGLGRCTIDVYTIRPDGTDLAQVTADTSEEWSVTWSPDGNRLMIGVIGDDGQGDLYAVDLDGFGTERITDTTGVDGMASWSPDGTRIVFASDRSGQRSLYTAAPDGSGVEPLAEGSMPAWSPDGTQIVYVAGRAGEGLDLWIVDDDGSNARPLVTGDRDELWPSWSPDGSQLAFTVDGALAIVNVERGDVHEIEIDRASIDGTVKEFTSWSVTGRIAFVSAGSLWTVLADGSDPIRVGGTPGRNLAPTWSPDGQLLAFIGSRWER